MFESINPNTGEIKEYSSLNEASKDGFNPGSIWKTIQNIKNQTKHKGYYWNFCNEEKICEFCKKNFIVFLKSNKKTDVCSRKCYLGLFRISHKQEIADYIKDKKQILQEYNKHYYQQNKEQRKKYSHEYRIHNKTKRNHYLNHRRKNDICFRFRHQVSCSIRKAIKDCGKEKNFSTWSKLPYTPQDLKEHLEKLWEPWMTWENYGSTDISKQTWQIDHIVPQSKLSFDSFDHPNFLKCWSLENLRPLESFENLYKSNRIILDE